MTFQSILFLRAEARPASESLAPPAFLPDLNLDQVIDALLLGRQEYGLAPFFYAPLQDPAAIRYRQEVFRDLEDRALFEQVQDFTIELCAVRRCLSLAEKTASAGKTEFRYYRAGWYLEAADVYCAAVTRLARALPAAGLRSTGLNDFRLYLAGYATSARFTALQAETQQLKAELSAIRYSLLIKDTAVKVRRYAAEPDYSLEVEQVFAKFQQSPAKDYRVKMEAGPGMSQVEARILDLVARLYPGPFERLSRFCERWFPGGEARFQDELLGLFDREVQFYIAVLDHIARYRPAGLKFCYPQVSDQSKAAYAREAFDLALAGLRLQTNSPGCSPVVCNDFDLRDPERVLVVTGPNQGGKTTFARMFAQLHYLAALGCPVPGREARLFLPDQIFTHFEKGDEARGRGGQLQDDLLRMHAILDQATPRSLIVLNEIFTAAPLADAAFLSRQVLERILRLDALCVCVTFIDELASLSPKTASLVSTVLPENPAVRTYKILRRPADGLSYAVSIAEKHSLTYRALKERLKG